MLEETKWMMANEERMKEKQTGGSVVVCPVRIRLNHHVLMWNSSFPLLPSCPARSPRLPACTGHLPCKYCIISDTGKHLLCSGRVNSNWKSLFSMWHKSVQREIRKSDTLDSHAFQGQTPALIVFVKLQLNYNQATIPPCWTLLASEGFLYVMWSCLSWRWKISDATSNRHSLIQQNWNPDKLVSANKLHL